VEKTPLQFEKLVGLIEGHASQDGANYSALEGFGTYRASTTHGRQPAVDLPAIWIVGQGKKLC
jgi:hypothetical protein